MDAALGPLEIPDSPPVHVLDATRFEVLEVLRVVDDAHQIGVAETGAYHVDGRARGVGLGSHQVFRLSGTAPSDTRPLLPSARLSKWRVVLYAKSTASSFANSSRIFSQRSLAEARLLRGSHR